MNRYLITYEESRQMEVTIEAESESAARQAFAECDFDAEPIEIATIETMVTAVTPEEGR